MIHVVYTVDGVTESKKFTDNAVGNSASVKFIKDLHDKRRNHAWYYKLKKIEALKSKMSLATRQKTRLKIKSELAVEQEDRDELLDLLGVTSAPSLLFIEIFKTDF